MISDGNYITREILMYEGIKFEFNLKEERME